MYVVLEPNIQFFMWLTPLNCDVSVLKFAKDVKGFQLVDVCVEHLIEELELIDEAKLGQDYDEEVHNNGDVSLNSDEDEVVNVDVGDEEVHKVNDDE